MIRGTEPLLLFLLACAVVAPPASAVQPLAQDHVVVFEAPALPDPDTLACVGSPDILQLPTGTLVASMELWLKLPNEGREGGIDYPNHCKIRVSRDGGQTWKPQGTNGITWGSLFWAQDALYLLGNDPHDRSIRIARSTDEGATWTPAAVLFDDSRYHGAPTNVLVREGTVYRAFEDQGQNWASLVIAGDLSQDLLDPAAWRMSPKVQLPQAVAPLLPPGSDATATGLEGNIIDARGRLRVLLRTRLGASPITGMTAVCELNDRDGAMDYAFLNYHAMSGGQNKFKLFYDAPSDLFWTVATVVPDPYQPEAPLAAAGFRGPPSNARRIAMLQYSYDALNWFQAGCVAMSRNPMEAFHYTSQTVSGDDLLVLSRTSVGGAPYNNHDTNRITFHRVKNFRSLALNLAPAFESSGN